MDNEEIFDENYLAFIRVLDSLRPKFFMDALCRKENKNTFFPGQGKRSVAQKAIAICNECPIKERCFEYAYEEKIEHGIWGASTPDARRTAWNDGLSALEAFTRLNQTEVD